MTVAVVAVCAAGIVFMLLRPTSRDLLQSARVALAAGQFDTACRLAEEEITLRPGNHAAILIGAEAALKAGDRERALQFLNWLPARMDDAEVYRGWLKKAEIQESLGQLRAQRETLEQIARSGPDTGTSPAQQQLARLLAGCGHAFDAVSLLRSLPPVEAMADQDLFLLAVNGDDLFGLQKLQRSHQLNPADPMPVAGLIAAARKRRDAAAIDDLLSKADWQTSALQREQLRQKLLYSASAGQVRPPSSDPAFAQLAGLLRDAIPDPETWMLAGELTRQAGNFDIALRCHVTAMRLDPWNRRAANAVADLTRETSPHISAAFTDLAQTLHRIENAARAVRADADEAAVLRQLANDLLMLGRDREALGWARRAVASAADDGWASDLIRAFHAESPRTARDHPADRYLATVSAPAPTEVVACLTGPARENPESAAIRFHDVAAATGLQFRYDNGRAPGQEGLFMHQWTGGGAGILDIDGDTWPDLMFSQGGVLSPDASVTSPGDALFRNLRGRHFVNVSPTAFRHRAGFGQGIAVADVNNDGFDDLYIGRAGDNVLLINQGDGTFRQNTDLPEASHWSTSVAVADLNADATPDIYDVNYLTGQGVFTTTCLHQGQRRICGPTDFEAAQDRVLLSDGDGTWKDVSATFFRDSPAQRGMGIVVGRFAQPSGLQIYVANDESANQLFVPAASGFYRDAAAEFGAAFNTFGEPQGSMGIALGDASGTQHADLFVTNYYAEANTFYRQVGPSVFVDATTSAGLSAPGFAMLGFGCQFADVNLDGRLDLAVANGHLDDFTHLGHPFHMPPQLFLNLGGGSFQEITPEGSYFAQQLLGRALALLDWNRDRRPDFVVTHIDREVSLVENRSVASGSGLCVEVVGTTVSRDAVGAIIELTADGSTARRWVTAGDGYQSSNQKISHFAVSAQNRQGILSVDFAAGDQIRTTVKTSTDRLMVIQGRPTAYALPR
ncbi:MAG: FG-GAP-like repeat-containing protein [Fuerstiella sp.]